MYTRLIKKNIKLAFFTLLTVVSLNLSAQKNWRFSNSTPRATVKTHLYFLDKIHYNADLVTYTLAGNLSKKKKLGLAKKLKVIFNKHHLQIENISNKRRGIIEKNKCILFDDMPQIYLIRQNKKWLYSEETVDNY